MRTVGFRKDIDESIICEKYISKEPSGIKLDVRNKELILKYLQKGTRIFSLTLWITKPEDIGPYMIFTDGVWIWQSHLIYFIEKGDFSGLDVDFFEFLKELDFIPQKEATLFLRDNMLK